MVDPPERGRSQALPNTGRFVTIDNEYAEKFWTATASNGDLWPFARLHSQWPGSGKLGDPVFDQFLASQVQSRADYMIAETLAQKAGARLLEKIGPSILVTHSSGASPGWLLADAVPHLVKAIVALEPLGKFTVPILATKSDLTRSTLRQSRHISRNSNIYKQARPTLRNHHSTNHLRPTTPLTRPSQYKNTTFHRPHNLRCPATNPPTTQTH